jgi:uncharacterized membrane protein HdeD (DUF308 family)
MDLEERVMAEDIGGWWWVFLLTGIVWLMIGFVVLRLDLSSVATVGFLIGALFVIATVNELMMASSANGGWKFLHWGIAALFIVGAIVSFAHPYNTFYALASILGFLLFFMGTLEIVRSIATRDVNPAWGLGLAVGILEILLAIWVSQQFFPARAELILIWVGFMAIFRGISQIVVAFGVRRVGREVRAAVG